MNHHALLSSVVVVTRALLFVNLALLLFVVLIPPVTKLLADYLPTGGFGSHLAAAIYGIGLEGRSVGFALLVEWTLREGRTQPSVPPDRRLAARLRYLAGPVAYLLAIGCAFIHPLLTLGLSGAVSGSQVNNVDAAIALRRPSPSPYLDPPLQASPKWPPRSSGKEPL